MKTNGMTEYPGKTISDPIHRDRDPTPHQFWGPNRRCGVLRKQGEAHAARDGPDEPVSATRNRDASRA
ncbi:hypothetical protein HYQ46_000804 [Verticillium longisporum]|nr:hypothetical protein HYQ46_000804 [Verticillium longisporum]